MSKQRTRADLSKLFPRAPINEDPHPACSCCGGGGVMLVDLAGAATEVPCWCVVYPRDQLALLAGYLGLLPERGLMPGRVLS